MNLALVGNDVWVGSFEACNQEASKFPNIIHIWRPENKMQHIACRHVMENLEHGLQVQWNEDEPLETMSVPFEEVMAYAQKPGKLLVHCAAGHSRSPTIAAAVLMARGCDPWQAIGLVAKAVYEYGAFPGFHWEVMLEILEWAHGRKRLWSIMSDKGRLYAPDTIDGWTKSFTEAKLFSSSHEAGDECTSLSGSVGRGYYNVVEIPTQIIEKFNLSA